MLYVGVDPGLSAIGAAVVNEDGDIVALDRIEIPARERTVAAYLEGGLRLYRFLDKHNESMTIMIEQMAVRKRDHTIDDNDLLSLAFLTGAMLPYLSSLMAKTTLVTPMGWKGNVPKKVMQNRLNRTYSLNLEEKYGAKAHDVYDALGMALYAKDNL